MGVEITTAIRGRHVSRAEIQRWEDRRITAAAHKLGVHVQTCGDVARRREELVRVKLALGSTEIATRLARDVRVADVVGRAQAQVSGRRRVSIADLFVTGGSARHFVQTFTEWTEGSCDESMLRACPDHFVIRTRADGRQEVLETTGGSPFAARFVIDYDDVSSLVTQADSSFPHQLAGVARGSDESAIGGVRHQFRDTDEGFHARLTVEFPLPTLGRMVSGHRWHLACEFSNWIEAAFR